VQQASKLNLKKQNESKEAEFNLSLALRSLQTNLDQDLSNARCNSIHFDFDLHFIQLQLQLLYTM
jgi:hypothetical protein